MTTPEQLAEELLALDLDADPIGASLYGLPGRDHLLPDISAAAEFAHREHAEDIRVRAMALDTTHAGLEDRLTLAIVVQHAQSTVNRLDARSPEHTVIGNLFAPVAGLLFHLGQVPVSGQQQSEDYLRRIARIPDFTAAAAQRHREGVRAGRVPVRPLLDDAIAHLDDHLAHPEQDPLLTQQLPDDLDHKRRRLIHEVVHPALAEYREVLAREIAPHARDADRPGLCWIPEGHEMYQRLIHAHTTTDHTPRELHEIGRAQLASLRAEISELGRRLWDEPDPEAVLRRMQTDRSLCWNDGEEMLAAAREAVAKATDAAPHWFGRLPQQPCEVRPVPGTPSESTPIGFYMSPALDGSRPGVYFANTLRAEQRPRFASEVIAFHEVVPGHHLQISLAQELTDLPLLRRLAGFNAYTEGWGLYTERLADEMGLYSDDLMRLGMVVQDLLRAARLVVDTGLHEFGWSRQRALETMTSSTTLSELEATSEVDRYIVYPGQALSYLVGRLEIQRIREAAQRRLGTEFDITKFHDTVLGHGALPISTLEFLVEDQPPATSR
ncbi:DUF885 domain-containing protein [Saccharopolyspora rhizosphaerae]|uniref:DUF885 domain-containing protein n=1 Tax=Saccharopolyspora rhizosphaerae TaxID=2492662 RepID=A0A3R8P3A5_9PSEU|nr:DUF885 domain-containing protein [Saccharopolyspora rhizosphaerae]RRO15654.1 DUF885 domain-containing protein [Saccharopolyspora rhizosphaerae]